MRGRGRRHEVVKEPAAHPQSSCPTLRSAWSSPCVTGEPMTYLPTSSPALVSAPDDQVRNLAVRTVAPAAAIVLRPGRAAGRGADPTPTRLWPLLVLVLADDAIRADPALTAVFSLLDEERPSAWPAFLEHPADWFVTDGPEPMVELAVHTSAHGGKDAVIALRARVLADVLPLLADKSPVALTTADRAARL